MIRLDYDSGKPGKLLILKILMSRNSELREVAVDIQVEA